MIKEELNVVVVDLCFSGCFEWWVWVVFLFNFVPFWISWFSLGARELSERSSRFSHFVYFRDSVNSSALYVRFTVLKFGFRCSCYNLKPKYLLGVLWVSLHFTFFFLVGPWFGPQIGPKSDWAKRGSRAHEARRCGSGPREKNPFDKQAEFGPWVLTRWLGSGMKKPNPNSTCCHS